MSGDLQALESRLVSDAPEYKSLMQGPSRLGQSRLAQGDPSTLNNLWLQYGQNMYNSRKGVGAGSAEQAVSSSQGDYDYDYDYGDYGSLGASLSGNLAGTRRQGLGGYGNAGLWDYNSRGLGLGRQYSGLGGSGLGYCE